VSSVARRRGLRIVAFGGGTGLSSLLRGLAALGSQVETTAIVAVSDDGGSTGRLRAEYGIPAVGDARACISATARHEEWAQLLEYRFRRPGLLHGHALGNLLLAALHEREGRLSRAITYVADMVGSTARVLPATDAAPRLIAQLADGRIIDGESVLGSVVGPVESIRLWPDVVAPAPGVIEAIDAAELLVFGPGSLFTSVIAAAMASGVSRAIARSSARKILVQNLTTQRGETDEMGVLDHVDAVRRHLGPQSLDAVLVHTWNGSPPSQGLVSDRRALNELGVREIPARLATEGGRGRLHDPLRLARALYRFGSCQDEEAPLRAVDL
jgi:uncharacterized cofD-like protein